MLFVLVSAQQRKKLSKGTIELMRNLHLMKALSTSTLPLRGTHHQKLKFISSAPQCKAALFFDLSSKGISGGVLGRFHMDPQAGTEEHILCSRIYGMQKHPGGVKLISIL